MSELDDLPPSVKLHVDFLRERFMQKKENRSQVVVAIHESGRPMLGFIHAVGDHGIGKASPTAVCLRKLVRDWLPRGPFANAAFFSEGYTPAKHLLKIAGDYTEDHARDDYRALQRLYGASLSDWPKDKREEIFLVTVAEPLHLWNVTIPFERTGGKLVLHEDRAMVIDDQREGAYAGGDVIKELRRLVAPPPERVN